MSSWLRSTCVFVSAGLGFAACGGERPIERLGGRDAGIEVRDIGNGAFDAIPLPDARDDVGQRDDGGSRDRDTGRDRGPPGSCEGCRCTSTATAAVAPFQQEDCQAGLLCVHWDLLSGLEVGRELEGPVKSCVKPCSTDGECGSGRRCAPLGFTASTGAENICVDRIAGFDEYCSGSRSPVEEVADPTVMDVADQITACEQGLTCQLFQFIDSFNPDESICAAFCESDADCAHLPNLPYCNPRVLPGATPMQDRGVCSDGKHPNGALCGSWDPDKSVRLATGCDTSVDTCGMNRDACPVCVGINLDQNSSLTPEGMGICMSACNNANPCAGGRACIPMFFSNGDGVCSDACDSMPETCAGAGSLFNGQDCLELSGGASFCTDRYVPSLLPSTWDPAGMVTFAGDDCTGDLNNFSFFRCPDGSTCVPTDQQGFCIYGCTPGDPMQGEALCQSLLGSMTAVCAEPQTGFGVCAD